MAVTLEANMIVLVAVAMRTPTMMTQSRSLLRRK